MTTVGLASQGKEHHFKYDGLARSIFGVWIINLLLNIPTFGMYSFWGKTRMRKYVASRFSLLGDRFEYNGQGGELFKGFIKVLPILFLLFLPFSIWPTTAWVNLMFIPILYFIFVAIYGALHYRMSRTIWRGIRGKLTGSAFHFAALRTGLAVMNLITLGILIPWSDIKSYQYIINNTYFGSAKARFDGGSSPLFIIHLITWILAIPTLGLSRFWYIAALRRHQYGHTCFDHIRLKATHTGGSLLMLVMVNFFLLVFTMSLATALVIQRKLQYFADHVFVVGDIDTIANIMQSDQRLATSGEGLETGLGLDSGIM